MRQLERNYYEAMMRSSMNRAVFFFFVGVFMIVASSWIALSIAWFFSGLALGKYHKTRSRLVAAEKIEADDPDNRLRGKDD